MTKSPHRRILQLFSDVVACKIFLGAFVLLMISIGGLAHPAGARPDLEYFPSRLHATIFRNWDIVPIDRLAKVLGTDKRSIRAAGRSMGLATPQNVSLEMQRRNIEMIIRRNWTLVPKEQIAGLLGFSGAELDEFL